MPDYPEKFAEIDGRIFLQAQLLMPQGNNPELSKVISILVFNVQHKLKAMLYHKENYLKIENFILNENAKSESKTIEIPQRESVSRLD